MILKSKDEQRKLITQPIVIINTTASQKFWPPAKIVINNWILVIWMSSSYNICSKTSLRDLAFVDTFAVKIHDITFDCN